jgi:hypothetical protein
MPQVITAQGEPIKKAPLKDGRVTVYNLKTGEGSRCHAIDAKERIAAGDWSYEPPEEKPKRGPKKSESAEK